MKVKAPLLLESNLCGKCCGTGLYSSYHGACWSCNGAGYKLTKRGSAAQVFLNSLRRQPIERFAVGDLMLIEGFHAGSYSEPTYWGTVSEVGAAYVTVSNPKHGNITIHGGVHRKGFTAAQKKEQQAMALDYQANLTKQGKPVKGSHIDLGL